MTNEFDIMDHPSVFRWFTEYAKTEPYGVTFLTGSNLEYYTKLLGEEGETIGAKQRYWKRDHLGFSLYIYCDDETTYYKVQYLGKKENYINDSKVGTYIIEFLNKLINYIKNF